MSYFKSNFLRIFNKYNLWLYFEISFTFKMATFAHFLCIAFVCFTVVNAGLAPCNIRTRIANGLEASPNQFPHMASLFDHRCSFHVCGGAIISNNLILSAASCYGYYKDHPYHLSASIGSTKFMKDAVIMNITAMVLHPLYEYGSYKNDLAVLETATHMEFSERINAIPLPSADFERRTTAHPMMCGFGGQFVSGIVVIF